MFSRPPHQHPSLIPHPTPIIDPTGAGDIFAVAFFTYLAETNNPQLAVRAGHIAAASSIQAHGDGGILWRKDIFGE
jgi:sugar/nucleoside kinase (ribokinase family)